MSYILAIITALSALWSNPGSDNLDNNTAFYQGEKCSYLIFPPNGFVMNTDESVEEGYSFAFVPDSVEYHNSDITISVNYFKIENSNFDFSEFLTNDTVNLRNFYGSTLEIEKIDPLTTETGNTFETYYLNDKTTFIPDVMFSYFYNESEILILSLSISSNFPRFEAEKFLISCIDRIRILQNGELES